jgi:hypothetical protein
MAYITGPCNVTECRDVIDNNACLASRLPTRDRDLIFGCVVGGAESVRGTTQDVLPPLGPLLPLSNLKI